MEEKASHATGLGCRAPDQHSREIHAEDFAFGYRFIADELPDRGITASENRVARLRSQERIWSVFSKKRGLNRKAGPPVHDDLVDRQFTAQAADELWLTDITEHRADEGKLYPCAIKDVWSNRIVGYSIDSRMKASLTVSALDNGEIAGPIGSSDQWIRQRSGIVSRRFASAEETIEMMSAEAVAAALADAGLEVADVDCLIVATSTRLVSPSNTGGISYLGVTPINGAS